MYENTSSLVDKTEMACLPNCLFSVLDRPSNQFFPSVCLSVSLCVCEQTGFRMITSTILCRFSPNFVCGSEMWLHWRLLFVRQTGSSLPILEVCGFQFWQFSGSGDHIFQQINKFRIWLRLIITSTFLYRFSPNFASGSGMSSHRRLFVTQIGSSSPILEVCGFWFRQFSGSGEHIFQQISSRSHVQTKFGNADFVFDGEWNRK